MDLVSFGYLSVFLINYFLIFFDVAIREALFVDTYVGSIV